MKQARGNKIFLLLILFLFFGCTHNEDKRIKVTARAYAEILLNKELYRGKPDSIKVKREATLKKYKLTEEDFQKAIDRMPADKEKWKIFFNEAKHFLDSVRSSYKEKLKIKK